MSHKLFLTVSQCFISNRSKFLALFEISLLNIVYLAPIYYTEGITIHHKQFILPTPFLNSSASPHTLKGCALHLEIKKTSNSNGAGY